MKIYHYFEFSFFLSLSAAILLICLIFPLASIIYQLFAEVGLLYEDEVYKWNEEENNVGAEL